QRQMLRGGGSGFGARLGTQPRNFADSDEMTADAGVRAPTNRGRGPQSALSNDTANDAELYSRSSGLQLQRIAQIVSGLDNRSLSAATLSSPASGNIRSSSESDSTGGNGG